MVNVDELKSKAISAISERGPSLPVHIAKSLGVDLMLASAILSELLKEKKIKLSNLRVGSSPLYLIPGQEEKLANFTENLNHVEKEAFNKLRDNKVLDDEKQEPKIRVALRQIKDFAIPIQVKGKTFWKFFTVSNEKAQQSLAEEETVAIGERVIGQKIIEDIEKSKEKAREFEQKTKEFEIKKQKLLEVEEAKNILEMSEEEKHRIPETASGKAEPKIPVQTKKKAEKARIEEKFLEEVKSSLIKKAEIISIEEFNKKQVIAKIRFILSPERVLLLFAFDKKRVDEKDVTRAYKKSLLYKLPYIIMCKGEISKKMKESIDAYKALLKIDKLE